MTTGEGWNVDGLANQMLCLSASFSSPRQSDAADVAPVQLMLCFPMTHK